MPGCAATSRWVPRILNRYCELRRAPGARVAFSTSREPLPRAHSHLQRTVGSVDKAKVLGFCQDHEGTFLMALRKRKRKRTLVE